MNTFKKTLMLTTKRKCSDTVQYLSSLCHDNKIIERRVPKNSRDSNSFHWNQNESGPRNCSVLAVLTVPLGTTT